MRDEPVQRPMQVFDRNRSIAAVGVRPSTAATAPDAGERAVPTPFPIWLGVALFVLAVALPLFRQTGTHSWRTIWAEDGSIYFQQAYQHGWLAVLFRGFAGYFQLPPRILGSLSIFVPFRDLALYFAVSAAVINALLAYFVYWASAEWIPSRIVRVALAAFVVLMPALGRENTATITNTIWTFAAVAPWALVSRAETPRAVALRSIIAFLAATSTPLTAVFLPLAIVYALIRRTRATWIVVAAFGIGLIVQAGIFTHTKSGIPVMGRQGAKVPELISVRVFAQYLLGDRGINAVWNVRGVLTIGAPVFVLAILAALFHRADRRHQLLATGFLAVAVASFVVPVWGRGTDLVALTGADTDLSFFHSSSTAYVAADRFSVVPVMMLASAVAVLVAGASKRGYRIRTQSMALVFAAHIALVTILGFPVTNARSSFPSWSATVASVYEKQCAGARSAKLVNVTPGAVGLLARSAFPVTIACRDLAP